jgi:hypothetical protein
MMHAHSAGLTPLLAVAPAAPRRTTRPLPRSRSRRQQWPQAHTPFHRDPRRLGSDSAFSVPLRDGRVLRLFGDTLVATTRTHVRSQAASAHRKLRQPSRWEPAADDQEIGVLAGGLH